MTNVDDTIRASRRTYIASLEGNLSIDARAASLRSRIRHAVLDIFGESALLAEFLDDVARRCEPHVTDEEIERLYEQMGAPEPALAWAPDEAFTNLVFELYVVCDFDENALTEQFYLFWEDLRRLGLSEERIARYFERFDAPS